MSVIQAITKGKKSDILVANGKNKINPTEIKDTFHLCLDRILVKFFSSHLSSRKS